MHYLQTGYIFCAALAGYRPNVSVRTTETQWAIDKSIVLQVTVSNHYAELKNKNLFL